MISGSASVEGEVFHINNLQNIAAETMVIRKMTTCFRIFLRKIQEVSYLVGSMVMLPKMKEPRQVQFLVNFMARMRTRLEGMAYR
jgi:hypothetical protein